MLVRVNGEQRQVTISNVYYAACLAHNLLSYCELERKGVVLSYKDGQRYLERNSDGAKVFEVVKENNVLTIKVEAASTRTVRSDVVYAAVHANDRDTESDGKIKCTLLDLHKRLGHLAFNTVEKMADASSSGIELIDRSRPNCLTCAQGKQSKNAQSKQDTGKNSPIDRIGGVICSDLKEPMTPMDRNKNRYMVNFTDHASNYCRVFVVKTKDQAAKMFEHFLVHFERMFNCKVHELRTDGGGEYKCADLFSKSTGVMRQVSEANNQASNGKAERMHRTVLNMARCMIFASSLPLYFWGDAVQYATYVFNRSPSSAKPKRMSPLEMLTGETPSISDIVVFGSPCTVHRNPGKKAWKHRAEVGVIVGKHDKTKDYKVYIPLDRVVVTTQHVTNVETLDVQGNRHLQEQLKRKDPTLEQSILGHEESARQKEQLNSPELNGRDTAERKEPQRNGKKKRGSRGKGTEGKSCCVDSIVKDTETCGDEYDDGERSQECGESPRNTATFLTHM
ncbi:unnamed protein product [Peronospora destructor]|uniref:Integrase catalytic domain-containing protein n=1 Tax=Peronospora destructor TaxID=86335 RepID=A0AAV0TFF5_9STRA|nr:unnamed protein product [Peronospora destructor]